MADIVAAHKRALGSATAREPSAHNPGPHASQPDAPYAESGDIDMDVDTDFASLQSPGDISLPSRGLSNALPPDSRPTESNKPGPRNKQKADEPPAPSKGKAPARRRADHLAPPSAVDEERRPAAFPAARSPTPPSEPDVEPHPGRIAVTTYANLPTYGQPAPQNADDFGPSVCVRCSLYHTPRSYFRFRSRPDSVASLARYVGAVAIWHTTAKRSASSAPRRGLGARTTPV